MMSTTAAIILSLFLATTQSASVLRSGNVDDIQRAICGLNQKLTCNLVPTTGSTVRGRVLFEPVYDEKSSDCHTLIRATVIGLNTNKQQAIHIHNYGDLSASTGVSLGGHFSSPGFVKYKHGLPGSPERHWGDFGSLQANSTGAAEYSRVDSMITIPGIVGRGMVVHEKADKGVEAQPTGGAGPRKAMCVIGYANPKYV